MTDFYRNRLLQTNAIHSFKDQQIADEKMRKDKASLKLGIKHASDELDISSLRKISLFEYNECIIKCKS